MWALRKKHYSSVRDFTAIMDIWTQAIEYEQAIEKGVETGHLSLLKKVLANNLAWPQKTHKATLQQQCFEELLMKESIILQIILT